MTIRKFVPFDEDELSWFPRRRRSAAFAVTTPPRRPRIWRFSEAIGVTTQEEDPDWLFLANRHRPALVGIPVTLISPIVQVLPPRARLVDEYGYPSREWWRWFQSVQMELDQLQQMVNKMLSEP